MLFFVYEFKLEIFWISFRHNRRDNRRNQFTRHRVFFCFFLITVLFVWLHILFVPPRRWRRMRRKLRSEQLPFLGWLVRDPLLVILYYSMSLVAWSQIHLLSLISDWDLGPRPPSHPPALKAISFDKSFSVRAGPFSLLRASRTWNDQAIEFENCRRFPKWEKRQRRAYGVNGTGKRTSLSHIPDMTTVAIPLQNKNDARNPDISCDLKSSSLWYIWHIISWSWLYDLSERILCYRWRCRQQY